MTKKKSLLNQEIPTVDNVFIRAYVDDKWQSLSLREVVDAGQPVQAFTWLMGVLFNHQEGERVTMEHILQGTKLLRYK